MSFGLELVNFYRGFRRPSSFAAAGPGCNRESDTPPFESAFVCGGAQVVQRKTAGDRKSRPYGGFESGPFFFVGAGHWPARREGSAIPKPTLIRLACARHLPPCRGKACGRPKVAPSKYGKLSGRSVGADDLGDPRAHTVRPYSGKRGGSVGSANLGAEVKPHQPQF